MLTVKHISLCGKETIYPAFTVEFRPADSKPKQEPPAKNSVVAFTESHYVVAELGDGTVFVMNEHGKTVSRYDIGASMVGPKVDARHTSEQSERRADH